MHFCPNICGQMDLFVLLNTINMTPPRQEWQESNNLHRANSVLITETEEINRDQKFDTDFVLLARHACTQF